MAQKTLASKKAGQRTGIVDGRRGKTPGIELTPKLRHAFFLRQSMSSFVRVNSIQSRARTIAKPHVPALQAKATKPKQPDQSQSPKQPEDEP